MYVQQVPTVMTSPHACRKVSQVTSNCHFHGLKLSMHARHYSWNDQGVVTWKISGEHQIPWLLSMRTKNRKLHKRKTVQRESRRMRTRDSANFPGWARLWKVSLWLQSKISSIVESAILRRLHFGPTHGQHGRRQSCALKCVCKLMKSTRDFEAASCERSIVRRRYAQFNILCENASARRKLQLRLCKSVLVPVDINKFLVDGKTINNRHKAVTIGFFFTDNMFRILTLQVRWQG